MSYFPAKTPALRVVDQLGNVTRGPIRLAPRYGLALHGVRLRKARVSYTPELVGPWTNLAWQTRMRLYGYRAAVSLEFALVEADAALGDWGLTLLAKLHEEAFTADDRAALQFNLFEAQAGPPYFSPWRGIWPTNGFDPQPLDAKSVRGFTLDLTFQAADLVSQAGRWAAYSW